MVILAILLAFVVPFFMYLLSRLQMTAWLNAMDNWLTTKGEEKDTNKEE